MCGIFGYYGDGDAFNEVLEGLQRLEYRGYDSWGIASITKDKFDIRKQVGAIGDAISTSKQNSNIAIGHTRWATHGGVTKTNCHPHYSTDKSFALAQNGIVENFQELRDALQKKGYKFITQTDTEVIVRLIEDKMKSANSFINAVRLAFVELKGRNTIILLHKPSQNIIAVKNGSPLVVGFGDNEYFFASDTLSFAHKTNRAIIMEDFQMIQFDAKQKSFETLDARTGKKILKKVEKLNLKNIEISKEGFDHFMLKEIVEQKDTIREAVQYTEEELKPLVKKLKSAKNVYLTGAGTAYFAASQIAFLLRDIAGINAVEIKSYEIESYRKVLKKNDLFFAISQSGETADTLEAVKVAKDAGCKIVSLVNMIGSTLTRASDYKFYTRSGPEICVASTKAFTAQCAWGYLLAKTVEDEYKQARNNIEKMSKSLQKYFNPETFSKFKKIVLSLKKPEHFFILGKGQNFNIALEGSLKIKEITYKHFEGFSAGELKHGVIALIEKGTPVFTIISNDEHKEYMIGTAAEVKTRGAKLYGVADKENDLFDVQIPKPAAVDEIDFLAQVIPFQLISYFLGVKLGHDPDKPRNLAKSVTVK